MSDKMYEKFHLASSSTIILHNPSDKLIFANIVTSTYATESMKFRTCKRTLHIFFTGACGDSHSIILFTLDCIGFDTIFTSLR